MDGNDVGKCPVMHGKSLASTFGGRTNKDWWPEALNIDVLHQNGARIDPMDADFDYRDRLQFSHGAIAAGLAALSQRRPIVVDVTMVQQGIRGNRPEFRFYQTNESWLAICACQTGHEPGWQNSNGIW